METTDIIILILLAVIQVILIMSVVHISAKTDEMAEILRSINNKLSKITDNVPDAPAEIRTSTPQKVRNVGNTWTCPDCGTENPLTVRNCKGCGRDK